MYLRHKLVTYIVSLLICIVSYFLHFQFATIVGSIIDIAAIASAIYLGIYPLLQGNERLQTNLSKQDSLLPQKTQMGVLNSYIKRGLLTNLVCIVYSLLFVVINGKYESIWVETESILLGLLSSFGFLITVLNLFYMFWIGKFMVNRVAFSK